MKIGFFTDTYLPVIHGVTISIETFKESLEKMGNDVFVFTPFLPGHKDKNPNVFRFRSVKAIKNPELRFGFPVLQNGSLRKIIDSKLDIVHAHTPFSLGLVGKFISERQKIPLIYTHHTDYPEYAKSYLLKEKKIVPYLTKRYCTWFANISTAVIAPSRKIKVLLEKDGVKRPVYVLATGVDLDSFAKTETSRKLSQRLRKDLGIGEKEKVLIFVGRMSEEKNIEFLLREFKKILQAQKDIKFLLIGDGPYLKQLKLMAKKMNLGNIFFLGAVPHEKIYIYYQAADIFLFASLTDTQGLVALEALASGLPVVALKDDALEGIVDDGKNGFLVNSASPEVFSGKVLDILNNKELYDKFSRQAEIIAENYSKESQAKKLLEIYQAVKRGYRN